MQSFSVLAIALCVKISCVVGGISFGNAAFLFYSL